MAGSLLERRPAAYVLRRRDPVNGQIFYVGSTSCLLRRLTEHLSGACLCTARLFGGDFEVASVEFPETLADARRLEDQRTAELSAEHGLARVYGAEFAAMPRPPREAALLLRRVDALLGRCYRCHRVHRPGRCAAAPPREEEADAEAKLAPEAGAAAAAEEEEEESSSPGRCAAAAPHPLASDPLFAASRELDGARRVNVGDFRSPLWSTLATLPETHPAQLKADLELRAVSTAEKPLVWYGHRCMAVNYWVCKDEADPAAQHFSPELRDALRRARLNGPLEDPAARPGAGGEGPRIKRRRAQELAATWEIQAQPDA